MTTAPTFRLSILQVIALAAWALSPVAIVIITRVIS